MPDVLSRLVYGTNSAYQISCPSSLFSCAIKLCNCCEHCRDENCTCRAKFYSQSKCYFLYRDLSKPSCANFTYFLINKSFLTRRVFIFFEMAWRFCKKCNCFSWNERMITLIAALQPPADFNLALAARNASARQTHAAPRAMLIQLQCHFTLSTKQQEHLFAENKLLINSALTTSRSELKFYVTHYSRIITESMSIGALVTQLRYCYTSLTSQQRNALTASKSIIYCQLYGAKEST